MRKVLGFMKEQLRTFMVVLPLSATVLLTALPAPVNAQLAIAEVIKAGVKKVIRAVNLKVQRLQNETIWLQNAQKVLENALSKLKLEEISDWSERQRNLYAGYYQELVRVKGLISGYKRVRELISTQKAIVQEYQWALGLFKKDKHFSSAERLHMGEVYEGILRESLANLDQVFMVLNSFSTSMSDAKRLEQISLAAEKIEANFSDLKAFNDGCMVMSIQRSKSVLETNKLKALYGMD